MPYWYIAGGGAEKRRKEGKIRNSRDKSYDWHQHKHWGEGWHFSRMRLLEQQLTAVRTNGH